MLDRLPLPPSLPPSDPPECPAAVLASFINIPVGHGSAHPENRGRSFRVLSLSLSLSLSLFLSRGIVGPRQERCIGGVYDVVAMHKSSCIGAKKRQQYSARARPRRPRRPSKESERFLTAAPFSSRGGNATICWLDDKWYTRWPIRWSEKLGDAYASFVMVTVVAPNGKRAAGTRNRSHLRRMGLLSVGIETGRRASARIPQSLKNQSLLRESPAGTGASRGC